MADWLDLDAPLDDFVRLLDTIRCTPELDWLLLSKRIGNWRKRLDEAAASIADEGPDYRGVAAFIELWLRGQAPANVVVMATLVNQAEADRDLPKLFAVPARRRGVSIEPMLEAINMLKLDADGRTPLSKLDWVIAGGESGPPARPAHPDWFRSLRDQCAAAGVPFHFKQWGEWWEVDSDARDEDGSHHVVNVPGIEAQERFDPKTDRLVAPDGRVFAALDALPEDVPCRQMTRLGKKFAGRLLDGVEHNAFPEHAA
jgi:hypothetical protein